MHRHASSAAHAAVNPEASANQLRPELLTPSSVSAPSRDSWDSPDHRWRQCL